jgi:hypothetical protein
MVRLLRPMIGRTKKIISSLVGKRLRLLDESLFEEISVGPDEVVHIFGEKDGASGVAGPVWEYGVTLRGRVKFRGGSRALRFYWERLELQGEHLLVKCGPHTRECSYFYRPFKRFVILSQNDVA